MTETLFYLPSPYAVNRHQTWIVHMPLSVLWGTTDYITLPYVVLDIYMCIIAVRDLGISIIDLQTYMYKLHWLFLCVLTLLKRCTVFRFSVVLKILIDEKILKFHKQFSVCITTSVLGTYVDCDGISLSLMTTGSNVQTVAIH